MKQPHILCEPKDISKYVILPGDPERVLRVGEFLEDWEEVAYNREFRTIKGIYKGVPITVTSTGIGGPSAAIAMEELIACGGEYFIRIGSGGAVQPYIKLGDLVIATAAVRDDGTTKMYIEEGYPAVADIKFTNIIIDICEDLGYNYHYGIIRSHDSFYIDEEDVIMRYWKEKNVLSSDMESSTILTLAQLRGVKAGCILNTVVEYNSHIKDGVGDYANKVLAPMEGEKREILLALETLYAIHHTHI